MTNNLYERYGVVLLIRNTLIAASHRVQADALEIEAMAKRRLADEHDAAQERGEVAKGRPKSVGEDNTFQATAADIGLSRTDIHEARQFRDAEANEPDIAYAPDQQGFCRYRLRQG